MIARSRWVEALLAGIATVVACWPVVPMVRGDDWIAPTLLGLTAVTVIGVLARAVRLPAWLVVVVQVVLGLLVLSWGLFPGTHRYGLPTSWTMQEATRLWVEGVTTVREEVVPVDDSLGIIVLLAIALSGIGLAVDAIAVTARSPALAGVPILVVATVTASNTGEPLDPRYFAATALAWLVLVSHEGLRRVRSWAPGRDAMAVSAWLRPAVARSRRRYTARARVLVVVAVALAALLPGFVPHLPTTAVVEGLARAAGAATGPVTFTESLDLSRDLGSRSDQPVLRYRTETARPGPLRVAVSTEYEDGRWRPVEPVMGEPVMPENAPLPPPGVNIERWTITVLENHLTPPRVAVPHPLVGGDFGQIPWGTDTTTGAALVAEQPASYEVETFRTVGTLPAGTGAWTVPDLRDPNVLAVDPESGPLVEELAHTYAGGAVTQVEAALLLQDSLRARPYVYSLALADPVTGDDGEPVDALTNFLLTQRGYCTQFATAMVMMARSLGIPARLAVGFLPGNEGEDGAYTVLARDAHAWPELYITGLGWTRFEPTPAERAPEAPEMFTERDPSAAPAPQAPTVAPTPEAGRPENDPDAGAEAPRFGSAAWAARARELLPPVLAGLGFLAVALLAVPLAGRRRRLGPMSRAGDDAAVVEAQWHRLVWSLADLGVEVPAGSSPRRDRERLTDATGLGGPAAEALGRVTALVEAVRYAPGPVRRGNVVDDVDTVVAAVRERSRRRTRLRARFLPRSGLALVADATDRVASAVRSAARWVGSVGLQRPSSSRSRQALRTAFPPPSLLK